MKRRIKRRRSRRNAGRIKKSVLIPLLLLAVAMLLMAASVYIDGFADWYAAWFYPVSAGAFGRVFGLVPTSVAEIGLYLTVIIFVLGMLYIILSLIHVNLLLLVRHGQPFSDKAGRESTVMDSLGTRFFICR